MLARARDIEARMSAWRRDFHQHPELGFQETRTAARVAEMLHNLGCRVRTGVGRSGVVGELGQGKPVMALRADMDALPIQETNEVPYVSQVPGVMHACGHDAHTAILLGVAALLAQEDFLGTVRFLFQPAEEIADEENMSGAMRMIQDGAMQDVDMVLALHVDAGTPVGDIRIESGPFSGGVDTFYASIMGLGGHGARPHEAVDPIYLTGHVLLALHGIVSRRLDPFAPAVISIGTIHGGQADNIIPEQVDLTGTIRFTEPEIQQQIHAEIEQALQVAHTLGGDYSLRFEIGTPPMINHPSAVELVMEVGADLLGQEHVLPRRTGLGAEDFGCLSELAPGAMFNLGCLIEDDERSHHNPRFDVDERCLPIGAAVLTESTLRYLRNHREE
ncbi:MAG: amidohydrolase [Chloroflexota bacterium]